MQALGKGKQETENAGIALRALVKQVAGKRPLADRLAATVSGKLLAVAVAKVRGGGCVDMHRHVPCAMWQYTNDAGS